MRMRLPIFLAFCAGLILTVTTCGPKAKPPSVPEISGPSSGAVGSVLTFRVISVDDNEDTIAYMVDWGDTSHPKWTDFHQSGESVSVSHVYRESSLCSVRLKAVNGKGGETDWSPEHALQLFTVGSGYPDSFLFVLPSGTGGYLRASKDGQYLYVGWGSAWLKVIRTSDHAIVDSINMGASQGKMTLSSDGALLYVCLGSADSIAVVRTSDNTLINYIRSGNVDATALSPDDQYLYAVTYNDHTLRSWRTSDYALLNTRSTGGMPTAIVTSPDGELLYVTTRRDSCVTVIDASSDSVLATWKMDDHPEDVWVSPDGKDVFVALYTRGVRVLSANDGSSVATISVGGYLWNLAATPDGSYLFAANEYYAGLPVIRTAFRTIVGQLTQAPGIHSVVVTSDCNCLYAADVDGRVLGFGRR